MDRSYIEFIKKLRDWEEDNQRKAEARKKEFVLLLGETGSGKSTLTQFLIDDSELKSKGCPGAYVITDKSGRISKADKTILSYTIHPECLSSTSSISVCDCPGFGDSRSTEQDIWCQFFTRNILGSFKAVKILFVISHAKLQSGGERNGFLNLVKHASEFMKNMKIFEKSIGLIVTKVENEIERIDNNLVLRTDDMIKENIVEYLKNMKSTIECERKSQDFPVEKKVLYENAIEFIDILFGGRTEEARLGLFRQPYQAGPINEIDTMTVAKNSLNKIINEQLIFTKSEAADFCYPLSELSKLYIVDLIPNIVEILNPLISKSFKEILNRYRMLEGNDDASVGNLVDKFSTHVEFWRKKSKQLKELSSTTAVLSFLIDCLISIPFEDPLGNNCSDDLKYYLGILRLFEGVKKNPLNCRASDWISSFSNIKNFVQNCQIWYSTLQTTFSNLSNRTDIPKYIESSCIVDINESMLKWVNQKSSVNGKEFKVIFDIVYEYGINDDFEISTVKLMHLIRLWDLYLAGLCPKVADKLKQLMKQLFERVSRRYEQLEDNDDIDTEQLKCQFLKHAECWKSTAVKLLKLDGTFDALNVMLDHLGNLPSEGSPFFDLMEDDKELRNEIDYYMEYSRNLKVATNHKFKRSDFIDLFNMVKDFVQKCAVWYSHLTKIFESLDNYKMRNFKSSEWIPRFENCLSDWLHQLPDIAITGRMFKDALDMVKFDISDDLEINTAKLKHLKHSWTAYLDSLVPKIICSLNELIESLFEGVITLYENLERNREVDLKSLEKIFSSHARDWKMTGENLNKLEKSPDVLDEIVKLLQHVETEIAGDGKSNRIVEDVEYYLKLMSYLEKANNFQSGIKHWLDAYSKARSYVEGSQVWYCTTLPTIHHSLFTYDIQQKRGYENALAFEKCLSDWIAEGRHVNGKQFKEHFDQISKCGVHDDLDIGSAKLNHLQRVLSCASSLGTKDEVENKDDLLTIKENVIQLSSILENLTSDVRKLEVRTSILEKRIGAIEETK